MSYRAPKVAIEALDQYSACFSFRSGQTHLLDAFTAELLSLLSSAPERDGLPAAEVTESLALTMQVPAAELLPRIEQALQSLLNLGLIEASDASE